MVHTHPKNGKQMAQRSAGLETATGSSKEGRLRVRWMKEIQRCDSKWRNGKRTVDRQRRMFTGNQKMSGFQSFCLVCHDV